MHTGFFGIYGSLQNRKIESSQGVGVTDLGIGGPTLTFITYPTAISLLPIAASFFGMIFYIALLTFGIDSAFSMVEPMVSGLHGKFKISKAKATGFMCMLGFFISLLFAFGSGLHWLDIVDHFIANFGLVMIGLVECLILGWMYSISKFRNHANETSEIKIGIWWDYLIKYVIPLALFLLLVIAIIDNVTNPYLGYPWWVVIIGGFIPCITIFLLSFVFMKLKNQKEVV